MIGKHSVRSLTMPAVARSEDLIREGAPFTNIMLYPESVSDESLFSAIDFWAVLQATPSCWQADVVAAMASGCVVLAPPGVCAEFGEGVLTVPPGALAKVIHGLWSQPELFTDQALRGRREFEEHFDRSNYLRLIRGTRR